MPGYTKNTARLVLLGDVFFKLHQRKNFSIQLAYNLKKQKHTSVFALSWGRWNHIWRLCAGCRNVCSISYSFSTFSTM